MRYVIALFLAGLIYENCQAQVVPFRNYRPGERYLYHITTESIRNGKSSGQSVAISEHTVVQDTVGFSERVKWVDKKIHQGDTILNQAGIAKQVPEYKISLAPGGKVLLPALVNPDMVGEITDLNTFYVAISPALNAQKLSEQQMVLKNPEIREGNFADNKRILFGKDCMIVTQELLKSVGEYLELKTTFSPPVNSCMRLLADSALKLSTDSAFNFQMIQKGPNEKVNYFWGIESFEIVTKVDRRTGKIVEATMVNDLNLKMLYNAAADLKKYDASLPVIIKRKVHLKLVSKNE